MSTEQLNQALYDKMAAEQERFRAQLLGTTPEEILDHAYEYAMRDDILVEMEGLELSAAQAAALLSSPAPLADVYREWNKVDARHMEDIRDVIEELADMRAKAQAATRAIPLYLENARYAREHGELDLLQASHKANIACRDAIEAAIRDGFDGMRLSGDAAKGVLARFGPERVAHVLAATLLGKAWDERFSRDTMAWAASVPMFDTGNRRYDYAINSHSTVLNGFVGLVRKEMAAARDQPEQASEKPSIRDQLAAAKAAQAEKPAAHQRQNTKEVR